MMAKVIVEGMQEDLWSWWMTRIMEGKFFIAGKKVTNIPLLSMYLLFLAPTGAQGVKMCVCVCVSVCVSA